MIDFWSNIDELWFYTFFWKKLKKNYAFFNFLDKYFILSVWRRQWYDLVKTGYS